MRILNVKQLKEYQSYVMTLEPIFFTDNNAENPMVTYKKKPMYKFVHKPAVFCNHYHDTNTKKNFR